MSRLKTELSWLRRRGAIKTDEEDGMGERACGRCRVELGRIINRGAECRACRQRVCKSCRNYSVNGRDWVCMVCHKQIEIQLASGEWMNEFVRRPSRRREPKAYVPPADVVKRSLIKRSWTISSPPSGGRTSPELRAHASRPSIIPRKSSRGSNSPADENEPPWDDPLYPPQGPPPRRYSMSSFDGVPAGPRHLKGPAPPPPQEQNYQRTSSPCSSPQRYSSPCESPVPPQRRRLLPVLPQQPSRTPPSKPERPSTLPRKLKDREARDTSRYSPPPPSSNHDPTRFHSMPRTKTRSPSGQGRGRSEPAHRMESSVMSLKETSGQWVYISSGPVTSTPIGLAPNQMGPRDSTTPPKPAPRDLTRPPANGRPPDQEASYHLTSSSSSSSSSLRRVSRRASPAAENPPPRPDSEGNNYTPKIRTHHIEIEGGSLGRPTRRRDGGDVNRSNRLEVEKPLLNHSNRLSSSRPDSGVSGSSRGGTSDNSDYDGDSSGVFHKITGGGPRLRQGVSPPGLTSGYATTGRRPTKPSHNPAAVRRSRSFQVGSRRLEDEFSCRSSSPTPPLALLGKDALSGQVARYVKELEKGIQMTVENMKPNKKPPLPPGDPSLRIPSKDAFHSLGRSRNLARRHSDKQHTKASPNDGSEPFVSKLEFEERTTLPHSDHSSSNNRNSDTSSDVALDSEKIVPEGDDYKIVFISSDSSKESELNSSIDSDNSGSPSRRVSSVNTINDSDTQGFIDESDWDYFESESQAGRRRKKNNTSIIANNNKNINNSNNMTSAPRVIIPTRVDACVMTEGDYLSASEGEDSEVDSPKVPETSLQLSLRVPSPDLIPCHQRDDSGVSNATTESQELQVSFDDNTPTTPIKDIVDNDPSASSPTPPPLIPTLRSLGTEELHAMLQQTEAVQAEAQALQAALMGAFTPSEGVLSVLPGSGRLFSRGDSTRSSAERSLGEFSCHDQVRALGISTPQETPALREYRKRVLTEIQNYYGVSSDLSGEERRGGIGGRGGGGGGGGRQVLGRRGTQPSHVKPHPERYSNSSSQQHPRHVSPVNAPKILSPLSYQQRPADKARVPSLHDNASPDVSGVKGLPSSKAVTSNIRRKESRDICIQTDPDPSGDVTNTWGEGDSTPESIDSTPSIRSLPIRNPLRGSDGGVVGIQQDTTAARVSRLVERIPTETQGFKRPPGNSVGEGGGGGGSVGHFGRVGGRGGIGFREQGRGRGGGAGGGGGGRGRVVGMGDEVMNPPSSYLPHPPSIHLHLTLSRETSVANPSDSETDERLLDTSSCVSSDLGADCASDFDSREYPSDSERWRATVERRQESHGVDEGQGGGGGSEITKRRKKEEAKEHGGSGRGQGVEETPQCPSITQSSSSCSSNSSSSSSATNTTTIKTNSNALLPPTTHDIRPPQPAPRKNMSALRPQLPSHTSLHQPPPPPHLQQNGGNLDALERVIPSMETPQADSPSPSPLVLEDDPLSSSRSITSEEEEDTDEDVHVSQSYVISGDADEEVEKGSEKECLPEDEVSSHLEAENQGDSSSSSGSEDTDDEKHVSKEYKLTKSSSTESAAEETAEVEKEEVDGVCLSDNVEDEVKGGDGTQDNNKNIVDGDNEGKNQELSDLIINNDNVNSETDTVNSSSSISENNSFNNNVCNTSDKMSLSNETLNVSDEKEIREGDENMSKEINEKEEEINILDGANDEKQQLLQSEIGVASGRETNDICVGNDNVDSTPLNVVSAGGGGDGAGDIIVGDSALVLEGIVGGDEKVIEDNSVCEEEVVEKHDVESTSENSEKENKVDMKLKDTDSDKEENNREDKDNDENTDSGVEERDDQMNDKEDDMDNLNNEKTVVESIDKSDVNENNKLTSQENQETDIVDEKKIDETSKETDLPDDSGASKDDKSDLLDSGASRDDKVDLLEENPSSKDADEAATVEVSEGLEISAECQGVVLEGTGHPNESDHPISAESEGLLEGDAEGEELATSVSATGEGESFECTSANTSADAGSAQVEQNGGGGGGVEHTSVTHSDPGEEHVPLQPPSVTDDDLTITSSSLSPSEIIDTSNDFDATLEETEITVIENAESKGKEGEGENNNTVERESSESGHSSAGESEVEGEDPANIVKISVIEEEHDGDGVSIPVSILDSDGIKQEVTRFAVRRVRSPEVTSRRTPPVPSRRTKRSSSSDGVSSSSDIERSDADASDSADTVIEGGKLHPELRRFALQQRIHDQDDKSRDSDGPSSADSVLHGADSESQCSDNSEEGNLVSIVSVGDDDEHTTRLSSHGKIYIRSDSTDSDVQIKPTCIVVTGSSGAESGDDGEGENKNNRNSKKPGNDVTILEVTSDGRCGHIMSVHVPSPDSSRSASPARRSHVSELQSMILTTRERQSQFRRSPTELKENSSSLANYFTRTLGTDSPHAPRRLNKTPEIRRRKVERTEIIESPTTTSPSSPAATPDHSEGDLLAYEENHGINIDDEYSIPHDYDSSEERGMSFPDEGELFNEDVSFDETLHEIPEYNEYDGVDMFGDQDGDGRFDSIEDGESIYSESNYSESSGDEIADREDELRGYCNRAIDFTLHTIIEESCEESDYERRPKDEDNAQADPSELEKYFYFGLGNGPADPKRYANEESEYSDTFSETSSSVFSEGVDVDPKYDEDVDPAELASSRLEKYFLTGMIGFERQPSIRSVGEDSELHTDESGSVGSDSEGSPSPEQPRKKLVRRPRGFRPGVANRGLVTPDRGDGAPSDGSHHSEGDEVDRTLVSGEDEGSTESEETAFDKGDGQFDTIKRRKKKKSSSDYSDKRSDSDKSELRVLEHHELELKEEICDLKNAETLKSLAQDQDKAIKRVTIDFDKDKMEKEGDLSDRKYQSRDSGFIGSSDDLLKDKPEDGIKDQKSRSSSESSAEEADCSLRKDDKNEVSKNEENKSDSFDNDSNNNKSENEDRSSGEGKVSRSSTGSSVDLPPFSPSKVRSKICRKDSFNNWSSDEETNMMMNRMRAFFKTLISNTREAPKGQRVKPPQLVTFEAKLTNLMKTVPGINDEQVKEIVEYLSSEETWSDSYDSSDYTSSDLEGAYALLDQADPERKSELQEQISASCKQIIQKFDQSREPSDTDSANSLFGGRAYSESSEDTSPSSKDTVFMYQRLMSSLTPRQDSDRGSIGSGSQGASPPLLAKVMHHIGNRLVALMHEVSGGSENGDDDSISLDHAATSSPKVPLFKPRKHKSVDSISIDSSVEKSSLTSTSFESEDSPTDTEQSPESDPGTPKARKRQDPLSASNERSSAEDFTSLESQRTVFASHDSPRHQTRLDATHTHQATASQRSLEERGVTNIQYFVTEGSNNEVEVWQSVTIDEDKFDAREVHGVPRARRSARRQEARKAKSHMSLEKIHQEEVKNTGERSESLGDLLDRVRSSEFSSSYEQLDSDSTLKASDSLDRHIGSSSSNIRLNASSRGSLTTSSRGSLAASSRGSLNAGSRGSLQGSSGPEEEDDKKPKKLSFFRYARRSSMPDTSKDNMSPEVRSTTLPRSNPTQVASTASLPRSQSALFNKMMPSVASSHASYSSPPSTLDRLTGTTSVTGPRSARYHAPGYKPPPPPATPKKTISSGLPASLRKDLVSSWAPQDESTGSIEEGLCQKGGGGSPSPLVGGSVGRTSGRESAASLASSTDNSTVTHPDEDIERLMLISEKKRNSLTPLGSRSESLASVCSAGAEGRYGTVIIKGEIELGLQYNYKEGQLECHVVQCRDLAAVDTKRNRSDPYVKVYLLPDKSKSGKRKTKVKKHTLNPVFEEVLRFNTTMSELDARTLSVSVWHSDMFGRNDFLGEVIISLADTVFDDVTPKWYPLQERTEPIEDVNYSPKGDIIIALKFVPPDAVNSKKARRSRGALHVLVKEAKNLAAVRPHGTADPVCKGLLLPEKGKSSKQKTSVCRKTLNPTWQNTLVFEDTSLQELTERALELSVWDHDRLGSSQFLGGCRLSLGKGKHGGRPVEWMEAAGMEVKLWEQMLERPNLWVEGSIMLRPTMDKPIYSSSMTE